MFIKVTRSKPPRLGLIIPIIDNMITARSGNTISTHYSTNSASATDPAHSSWTQVQSATISTSDHCKPLWGEASSNENQILTFTYKDVTGGYNFS